MEEGRAAARQRRLTARSASSIDIASPVRRRRNKPRFGVRGGHPVCGVWAAMF
jgi:hypothetical protein